jgi:hypothetical protein
MVMKLVLGRASAAITMVLFAMAAFAAYVRHRVQQIPSRQVVSAAAARHT